MYAHIMFFLVSFFIFYSLCVVEFLSVLLRVRVWASVLDATGVISVGLACRRCRGGLSGVHGLAGVVPADDPLCGEIRTPWYMSAARWLPPWYNAR